MNYIYDRYDMVKGVGVGLAAPGGGLALCMEEEGGDREREVVVGGETASVEVGA